MLGASIATLGPLLLAFGLFATHPMGAVERCRQAVEAARVIPTSGHRP